MISDSSPNVSLSARSAYDGGYGPKYGVDVVSGEDLNFVCVVARAHLGLEDKEVVTPDHGYDLY